MDSTSHELPNSQLGTETGPGVDHESNHQDYIATTGSDLEQLESMLTMAEVSYIQKITLVEKIHQQWY